mmetsp:Transcript_9240/g.25846  ORF Transcript_9240/g.25846 Transcript_9240/m.25846 type:complete len:137 (+) Transcript_9240:272-682(+)
MGLQEGIVPLKQPCCLPRLRHTSTTLALRTLVKRIPKVLNSASGHWKIFWLVCLFTSPMWISLASLQTHSHALMAGGRCCKSITSSIALVCFAKVHGMALAHVGQGLACAREKGCVQSVAFWFRKARLAGAVCVYK